jgi:FkbM family methyltransferase
MSASLSTIQVSAGGASRPFFYREGSAGDRGVVDQIFTHGDYALGSLRQRHAFERYQRETVARGATPLIVDAGANIGASAVWFSLTYPKSHLVAIEPERNNAALLRRNCEGLGCAVIEGGIGRVDGKMFLDDPGHGDWGFRLSAEGGSYEVATHACSTLVERLQNEALVPLIFKCDIEGGEANLFSGDVGWVDAFPLLIVELHDWMLPGSANSRNFLRAISALDMDFIYRGENAFCFNNRLLSAYAHESMTRVEALRLQALEKPSADAFLALSFACYEAKDFPGCIAANTEALKLQPGFSQAYNNLGLALVELGRYTEAELALETALRLAPDFVLARNNLAWVRGRVSAASM